MKAEGIIGMARAFLSAGAHLVLVLLWKVPDESAHMFINFLVNDYSASKPRKDQYSDVATLVIMQQNVH